MEACPFCSTSIDEDVVVYGGTCPSCFAHIPGEEAATDPGEDVKLAQAAQDRQRAKRRALMPLLLAVPVVLAVVGGALYLALRPAPELAMLDLDDGEFYSPDLDVLIVAQVSDERTAAANDTGAPAARSNGDKPRVAATKRKVDSRAAPVMTRPKLSGASGGDDAELLANLGPGEGEDLVRKVRGGADLAPSGLADDLDIAGGLTSSSVGSAGFQMDAGKVSQSGPPLSDPQKIAYMVQRVLRKQLPRLKGCYEGSLRANPQLRGSWVVTFTIETDGSVGKARAVGRDMADPALEECLTRRVDAWRFNRIVKPQPVKKTVEFKR